jgi:hypothetical protein
MMSHFKNPPPHLLNKTLKEMPGAPQIVDVQPVGDFQTKTCPCPWHCETTLTFNDNGFGVKANNSFYAKGLSAIANHLKRSCPNRPVQCRTCKSWVSFAEIDSHIC